MASNKSPTDDTVGYRNPPKSTRFKPGQSGNPGGRKKGSVNVWTALQRVLESDIVITENGKKKKIPPLEALFKRMLQSALQGDWRAAQDLLERCERHDRSAEVEEELPEEDRALLDRMRAERLVPTGLTGQDDDGSAREGDDE
jgi:hypothetical protein